jgi:hypothetical protein
MGETATIWFTKGGTTRPNGKSHSFGRYIELNVIGDEHGFQALLGSADCHWRQPESIAAMW